MNVNTKAIKSSIQSIGNSLVVAGLIASLFKSEVSTLIVFTSIIAGVIFIIYASLEDK